MEKTLVNSPLPKQIKSKIEVIESTLHQVIYYFRDFLTELEYVHMEAECAKKQITTQLEKCERKSCIGSVELKKVIESKDNIIQTKDNIIQSVASALTELDETKNFMLLKEIFKILYGELPCHDVSVKEVNSNLNIQRSSESPDKPNEINDMSIKDESVFEIEGTPTGRRSPIIQTKKLKSSTPNNNSREKKKCPDNWPTPEKKSYKVALTPTKSKPLKKGGGRLRQQRLTMIKHKPDNIVDLTTSPQFNVGRTSQEELLTNVKQEAIENDDTILPSPTSGPAFPSFYKGSSKESPQKFKKPLSLLRTKTEKSPEQDNKTNVVKMKNIGIKGQDNDATCLSELNNSINILEGIITSPKKCKSEKKSPISMKENISLLQPANKAENNESETQLNLSPSKRPLAENINCGNVACDSDSSMSILRRDVKVIKMEIPDEGNQKSKTEVPEPLYKEPTVRKKAEKQALQGWACDECIQFYTAHYKDDPEKAEAKIKECSKHRGKHNPAPPRSPAGFWRVRWDVPQDTDEFNRRNNAV